MRNNRKAGEIAANRVQLLAPLLAEGIDGAKARQLREQICSQTGMSDRTVRRYLNAYREYGYDGLKPSKRNVTREDAIAPHIMEQAI